MPRLISPRVSAEIDRSSSTWALSQAAMPGDGFGFVASLNMFVSMR
jgi:hypothetical protein